MTEIYYKCDNSYILKKTLEEFKIKIIKLKFMIYVVTGCSGFIGFHVAKQLLKKIIL